MNPNSIIETTLKDYATWTEHRPETKSNIVQINQVQNSQPKQIICFDLVTAYEVQKMNIPPVQWIVNNLLCEGLFLIAGKPKAGKSFLSLKLAIDVCNGNKVMNYFPSNKCSVLYLAYEDNFRRLQGRANTLISSNETIPDNLYYPKDLVSMPKLNEGGLESLQGLIGKDPLIKLIIVDTLGRAFKQIRSTKNNAYLDDYDQMSILQSFATKNHICIFVVHHTRKALSDDPFDSISGTNGIAGSCDGTLILQRQQGKKDKGILSIQGREIETNDYSLNFSDCIWTIEGFKAEVELSGDKRNIIDLFDKDYTKQLTLAEIAKALGKPKPYISNICTKIVKVGEIRKVSYGVYALNEINYNTD